MVFSLYATIKMMHGPINIRFIWFSCIVCRVSVWFSVDETTVIVLNVICRINAIF